MLLTNDPVLLPYFSVDRLNQYTDNLPAHRS
jgi:hypothetical protein